VVVGGDEPGVFDEGLGKQLLARAEQRRSVAVEWGPIRVTELGRIVEEIAQVVDDVAARNHPDDGVAGRLARGRNKVDAGHDLALAWE